MPALCYCGRLARSREMAGRVVMDRTDQLRAVLAKLREIGADFGAEGRQLRRLTEECEALVGAVDAAPEPCAPRKTG